MDRKELDSFTDFKSSGGSGFGIVDDFSAITMGEDFLNEMSEPKKIKESQPPTKDKDPKPEEKEDKPTPIVLEEDHLSLGEDFLNDTKEEEEESTDDDPLLKDTPPKKEAKETKPNPVEGEENSFQIIANQLLESGLFTLDEEEESIDISDGESLLERFTYEKNKQAHTTIYDFLSSKHGEEGVEVFDAIFQRGVPIKDYLQKYSETEDLADLPLEGEENARNQRRIMQAVLESQGLEQSDIDAEIEKLDNYGDLETSAKRYHKAVVKRKQEELKAIETQAEEKKKREEQRITYHNNYMNQILAQKLKDRQFDGIPVTDKVARDTYEKLTKPSFKMPDGSVGTSFDAYLYNLNHPDNYQEKVKLALLVELMKKDPSFETLKKKGVSEKTDQLFGKLVTQEKKVKHNHPINTPSKGFADGI